MCFKYCSLHFHPNSWKLNPLDNLGFVSEGDLQTWKEYI